MRFIKSLVILTTFTYSIHSVHAQSLDDQTLDEAIVDVGRQILDAQKDSDKYSGGSIKIIISLRLQTLKSTLAMLEQKKRSWVHLIKLNYTIDGEPVPPADKETLRALQVEMQTAVAEIDAANAEAAKYRGGLIQTMALLRAATGQANYAALGMKHAAYK